MHVIWRDTCHAPRSLRSTPAFPTVALAVLALSIGATTAIYSVVDGVMLLVYATLMSGVCLLARVVATRHALGLEPTVTLRVDEP